MAYQTPLTVKETLEAIAQNRFVLPAIQRELVWAQEPGADDPAVRQHPPGVSDRHVPVLEGHAGAGQTIHTPAFQIRSRLWKDVHDDRIISYFEVREQSLSKVLDIFVRGQQRRCGADQERLVAVHRHGAVRRS